MEHIMTNEYTTLPKKMECECGNDSKLQAKENIRGDVTYVYECTGRNCKKVKKMN